LKSQFFSLSFNIGGRDFSAHKMILDFAFWQRKTNIWLPFSSTKESLTNRMKLTGNRVQFDKLETMAYGLFICAYKNCWTSSLPWWPSAPHSIE
jgi:hypothetical protein